MTGDQHGEAWRSLATYRNSGRRDEAEELEVQMMETRKVELGAEHPDTLTSVNHLTYTWKAGRRDEAEELEVQVMETCKMKLGADHPDTLTSMNHLTYTWKSEHSR
jgi:hypothetical protein